MGRQDKRRVALESPAGPWHVGRLMGTVQRPPSGSKNSPGPMRRQGSTTDRPGNRSAAPRAGTRTMKGAAKGPAPPREVTAASVAPMAADVKKEATNKSAKARRTRRTRRTKQCRRRRVATKNRGPTGAEAIKKGRAAARPRSRTSQAKASFKNMRKDGKEEEGEHAELEL